jgi:UDP-N-acetylglucosamine/UDP-N-acetylgalactosamine diphosphorylase
MHHTDAPFDAEPVSYYPYIPDSDELKNLYSDAEQKGKELISAGNIAVLTVAGGQGTRLGFDAPKGTYPITPVRKKSLFQYFAESVYRASEKFSCRLDWFIMTSKVNDEDTKNFFIRNNYFGLNEDQVHFFVQGVMPVVGPDGKIMMADKGNILFSPDGHGGTLTALKKSGLLDYMRKRNIEHISYFQVDNPLVPVLNPVFIGLHYLKNSDVSSRVLKKRCPEEKLGLFCRVNGKIKVIEYSDLPLSLAVKKNSDGSFVFDAGSPAIHIFKREFIESLTVGHRIKLPWHKAVKKIKCLDLSDTTNSVHESVGIKFETFIFDTIPFAENPLLIEGCRKDEFAPVKNRSGEDSPETCRQALIFKDAEKLLKADVDVPFDGNGKPSAVIELSPRSFFDTEDVINKFKSSEKPLIQPGKEIYIQ